MLELYQHYILLTRSVVCCTL